MTYLHLIIEFVKISLFSFGGGYGTLPFIYYISEQYGWYSAKEIMQMIAIAAVTPGAFGVNMATYTGFKISSGLGALIATTALIIPSFILTIFVYKILKKYKDTPLAKDTLETLRAIASGLLFVVVLKMFNQEILHFNISDMSINFSLKAFIFLCYSAAIYYLVKKNILLTMIITLISGIGLVVLRHYLVYFIH